MSGARGEHARDPGDPLYRTHAGRRASLAAAKDLLAAQRAVERRAPAAPHDLADLADLATEPARG